MGGRGDYQRVGEGFQNVPGYQRRADTSVRNNNVLNPFSSNTTNPEHWGESVPENLKAPKDFFEFMAFSYFFVGIYWTSLYVYLLVQRSHLLPSWWQWALLALSVPGFGYLCFKRCEEWFEFSALEYWQPAKDIVRKLYRRGGPRAGLASLIVALTSKFSRHLVAWHWTED